MLINDQTKETHHIFASGVVELFIDFFHLHLRSKCSLVSGLSDGSH